MLPDNLKNIVQSGQNKNASVEYIKIELKEMLIYYTLNFGTGRRLGWWKS